MARYTYTPGGRLATIESGNGIITRYTYDGEETCPETHCSL